MPKRISVAKHLTIEQLEQHYRQARDGVESRQYQIIGLLAPGKKTEEVAEISLFCHSPRLKIKRIISLRS